MKIRSLDIFNRKKRKTSIIQFCVMLVFVLSIVSFISPRVAFAGESVKDDEPEYLDGEMIVVYKDETIEQVEIEDGASVEEAIEEVEENEDVLFAQPNYIYHTMEGEELTTLNDEYFSECYYLEATNSLRAWQKGTDASSVSVAVVDTGCRLTHEDLKDQINLDLACDIYKTYINAKRSGTDQNLTSEANKNWIYLKDRYEEGFSGDGASNSHGTVVSSIVGGSVNNELGGAGASNGASIIPIKAFPDDGSDASTATLTLSLNYLKMCIDENKIDNLKVVNISAGTAAETDQALRTAIKELRDRGVLTVCAAGNKSSSIGKNSLVSPGDFPEALAVTATQKDLESTEDIDEGRTLASFSCFNEYKDIAAPGAAIFGAVNTGDSDYSITSGKSGYDGTSFAAPVVSGICAFLWANHPDWTVEQMVEAIERTATEFNDQYEASFQSENPSKSDHSAGVIDALAAMDYDDDSIIDLEKYGEISIREDDELEYTGEPIEPEIYVFGELLEKDKDYTIEFSGESTGVGEMSVTVQGIGKYSGSLSRHYNVTLSLNKKKTVSSQKLDEEGNPILDDDGNPAMEQKTATVLKVSYTAPSYDGTEKEPAFTICWREDESKVLKLGEDYKILYYRNNVNAATSSDFSSPKVTFKGIGNYTGTWTLSFTIRPRTLSGNVVLQKTSYPFTGNMVVPLLIDNDETLGDLIQNSDYSFEIISGDGIKKGTVTSKVTGTGNYTGSMEVSYTITAADITDVTLSTKQYTGAKILPTVKLNGYTMTYGTDYKIVSIKNNVKIGTATVELKGKGNLSGTVKKTFKIIPKTIKLEKVKAIVSGFNVYWKSRASQVSGYQVQFSSDSSFAADHTKTVKVSGGKVAKKSLTNRVSGKKYYVRVRGYKYLKGKTYYSKWSEVKVVTTK